MLSGSEFDELDAQLEQFIMEEGEDLLVEQNAMEKSSSSTPTQPNLLSQHADLLKSRVEVKPEPV